MHKTTVNLPEDIYLRLRNLSRRSGRPLAEVITALLSDGLLADAGAFESHAVGEADVDDLGINSEKYLREGLR